MAEILTKLLHDLPGIVLAAGIVLAVVKFTDLVKGDGA